MRLFIPSPLAFRYALMQRRLLAIVAALCIFESSRKLNGLFDPHGSALFTLLEVCSVAADRLRAKP